MTQISVFDIYQSTTAAARLEIQISIVISRLVLPGAKIVHQEILEIICIILIYLDGSMAQSEEGDKETPKIFFPFATLYMLHLNMPYGLDWSLELISFNLL